MNSHSQLQIFQSLNFHVFENFIEQPGPIDFTRMNRNNGFSSAGCGENDDCLLTRKTTKPARRNAANTSRREVGADGA